MRDAAGLERREREVAGLDRVVDQFVVVRGAIAAEPVRRARPRAAASSRRASRAKAAPSGGTMSTMHGASSRPSGQQEHRRAVEVAARAVEVGGAHRQVVRVDLRDDGQRPDARRGAPDVLGVLGDRHRTRRPTSARTCTKCRANSRIR